jgi:hypothetical protein
MHLAGGFEISGFRGSSGEACSSEKIARTQKLVWRSAALTLVEFIEFISVGFDCLCVSCGFLFWNLWSIFFSYSVDRL